tara:strand:+ start:2096 stop:4063 length:1968 start_codon:yes stop_codon:yes gene_type:complete
MYEVYMSTKPLIYSPEVTFEKVASTARLESDANEWPSEILKVAYKTLPYLRAYEVDVDLDKIDEARGYGIGKLLIYPARMTKQAAAQQDRLISFPVIVKDREMSPLDVYSHKSTMHPESEEAVESLLFRPDLFESNAKPNTFGGHDLGGQINPPTMNLRPNTGIQKLSSVNLWKAALPTFRDADVDSFKKSVSNSMGVKIAFATSEVLKAIVEDLADHKEVTASDLASSRVESTPPSTVQFVADGMGYRVKTASHRCYAPTEKTIDRFEAEDVLSKEAMDRLKKDGILTLTVDPIEESFTVKTAQEANRFGVYSTRVGSKDVEGVVVPRMISLEGKELDLQVFAGEGEHAVQEKIAGVFKNDVIVPDAAPRGSGIFVYQSGPMAVATEPVEITNRFSINYGTEKVAQYSGKTSVYGEPVQITVVPGLQKIASTGPGQYAIPDTFRFVPLNGKQVTVAATTDSVDLFEKQKVAGRNSVEVISDGSFYSLRGANSESAFGGEVLNKAEAEFALSAMGVAGNQVRGLLKKASANGSVRIPHTRQVVLEATAKSALLKEASDNAVDVTPYRVDLVKEASVIVDKETADAILSLGFVTPENVSLYVDYLPELEKVSSKLAEILVASRLGMDDVRESAAKNAMTQLTSVVQGLGQLKAKTQ